MKYKYSKLYWFLKSFEWMSVYFSPFKPPIPRFYIGKVAVGTPYFFPRVWKKATPEKAYEATIKEIEDVKKYNEKEQIYKRTVRTYDEIYTQKINSSFAQPKKIGFDFVNLGWKTKYDSFRHEWNPVWSFVFFKYQFAITFVPKHDNHFWECFLVFNYETDKKLDWASRLKQAQEKFPCVWRTYRDGVEDKVCYWNLILHKKFI